MNLVGQLLVKLIMTLLVGKDLCPKLSKLVKLEMAFSLSRQNWIGSPLPRDDEALDGGQVFFFKPRQRNSYSILCCSPLRYEGLLGAEGKWHFNHPSRTAFPLTIK